jgi:hypothetical protein
LYGYKTVDVSGKRQFESKIFGFRIGFILPARCIMRCIIRRPSRKSCKHKNYKSVAPAYKAAVLQKSGCSLQTGYAIFAGDDQNWARTEKGPALVRACPGCDSSLQSWDLDKSNVDLYNIVDGCAIE